MILQQKLKDIILEAGLMVMKIYADAFTVSFKEDSSPLTQADLRANDFICDALTKLYPDIPIISEESTQIPFTKRQDWQYYWCIDPIDGTQEFINKSGEFTINIALMHDNKPIFTLVYAPVFETLYYATKGEGAYKQTKTQIQKLPLKNTTKEYTALISHSRHTPKTQIFLDALLECRDSIETLSVGSSLKFCKIAEGSADIYAKFSNTMEWDTAAAHLILQESGGEIYIYDAKLDPCAYLSPKVKDLEPLKYNKTDLTNPHFIALSTSKRVSAT